MMHKDFVQAKDARQNEFNTRLLGIPDLRILFQGQRQDRILQLRYSIPKRLS